jgi:hypothetical protein
MPPELRYEVHGADTVGRGCADGCGCIGVVLAVVAVVAAVLEMMSR